MQKYHNPILKGFYPDPSVCRVGSDYYMVTSTFEFFPGVPIFHSKNLINWTKIGHCLTRKSQLDLTNCLPSKGIWAPTIRYNNGTFYMITTVMNQFGECKKFMVTTKDINKEWSDPIWIDQRGIDPSIFFDDDGKVYLTSNGAPTSDGRRGIWQNELDITTGKVGESRFLWGGISNKYPEGPHLYKWHGYYYLSIAEGGCQYGHMQTIARSKSPWGPFEVYESNPFLTNRDQDHRQAIQGIGHLDIVDDEFGNLWGYCLGYRPSCQYFYHLGRETFLVPVRFDQNNWLQAGDNGIVNMEMIANLPYKFNEPELVNELENFDSENISMEYVYLRNPIEENYSLKERDNYLAMRLGQGNLNSNSAISWLGRRLTNFEAMFSVKIDFEPQNDFEEAGISAFYYSEHHYEIAIIKELEVKKIVVKKRIADLIATVAKMDAPAGEIELGINCEKEFMEFGFFHKGEFIKLASGSTRYLSCESAKVGFTGVFLAMYCTGNGTDSTNKAYFDYAKYQER